MLSAAKYMSSIFTSSASSESVCVYENVCEAKGQKRETPFLNIPDTEG